MDEPFLRVTVPRSVHRELVLAEADTADRNDADSVLLAEQIRGARPMPGDRFEIALTRDTAAVLGDSIDGHAERLTHTGETGATLLRDLAIVRSLRAVQRRIDAALDSSPSNT